MEHKRARRVGEMVQSELADILLRKIKDPRVGFTTITAVRFSDDLKSARVFVSVLGGPQEKKDTINGLKSASGFIRREIGRRLRLRYTPDISFHLDESIEKGDRILATLRELEEKAGPDKGHGGDGGGEGPDGPEGDGGDG